MEAHLQYRVFRTLSGLWLSTRVLSLGGMVSQQSGGTPIDH